MTLFSKLPLETRQGILNRLQARKARFFKCVKNARSLSTKVLLVGDRPGPGAPTDPSYHHTPFYSIRNCSGWLNKQLHDAEIPEEDLLWVNSADKDGVVSDGSFLVNLEGTQVIIALGGNAAKWCAKQGLAHELIHHPQYWKRFRSKEPYVLIPLLKKLTSP